MTSKESVLLFFPNAVCRRGQPDLKWRVTNGGEELGWGWRPGSAWNSVDSQIRKTLGDEIYFQAICTAQVPESIKPKLKGLFEGRV